MVSKVGVTCEQKKKKVVLVQLKKKLIMTKISVFLPIFANLANDYISSRDHSIPAKIVCKVLYTVIVGFL